MLKMYINLVGGDKIEIRIDETYINQEVEAIFKSERCIDEKYIISFTTKNAIVLFDGVNKDLSKEILKSVLKIEAKTI